MEARIVIEGLEDVIKRDLDKHKAILEQTKVELNAYRLSVSYLIQRKKNFNKLIGEGKYDDESLAVSVEGIRVDIVGMQNKIKLSTDKIKHETLIVDTLTKQLSDQNKGLEELAKFRKKQNGTTN